MRAVFVMLIAWLISGNWYYLAGGMQNPQAVTADVYRFRIE